MWLEIISSISRGRTRWYIAKKKKDIEKNTEPVTKRDQSQEPVAKCDQSKVVVKIDDNQQLAVTNCDRKTVW